MQLKVGTLGFCSGQTWTLCEPSQARVWLLDLLRFGGCGPSLGSFSAKVSSTQASFRPMSVTGTQPVHLTTDVLYLLSGNLCRVQSAAAPEIPQSNVFFNVVVKLHIIFDLCSFTRSLSNTASPTCVAER